MPEPPEGPSASAPTGDDAIADLVRGADYDRWLAVLFAPAVVRADLLAIAAFHAEVARVRDVVSEPMPGEIRLQWWRDVVDGLGDERGAAGHPVARALEGVIARRHLPRAPFAAMIDAHVFDLYDDPMPSIADLEGYAGETASALLQLGALVLSGGEDPASADAAGHAGVALTIGWVLQGLGRHAARGQLYLPVELLDRHGAQREDILAGRVTAGVVAALDELRAAARRHLAAARTAYALVSPSARPAFIVTGLVEPMLRRSARGAARPFGEAAALPRFAKVWHLWWAARRMARGAPPF